MVLIVYAVLRSYLDFKGKLRFFSHVNAQEQIFLHPRWHTFRTMCDSNKRLGVALELTEDLPSYTVLQRWLAEPVRAVILSTNLFLTNKKGYPVLSRTHQGYLRSLFKVRQGYPDKSPFGHFFAQTDNSLFVVLQGWTILCSCVCLGYKKQ